MAFGLLWSFVALCGAAPAAAESVEAASAAVERPWRNAAPFSLDPGELYAATQLAVDDPFAADAGVVVLFQDTKYRFDDAGRLTQHRHWIYRIVAAESIPDWSTSQVRWAPWRQEQPRLRARVITPAGDEHWLDPGTARDRQAPETTPSNHRAPPPSAPVPGRPRPGPGVAPATAVAPRSWRTHRTPRRAFGTAARCACPPRTLPRRCGGIADFGRVPCSSPPRW